MGSQAGGTKAHKIKNHSDKKPTGLPKRAAFLLSNEIENEFQSIQIRFI
jgi:hypothetical protein